MKRLLSNFSKDQIKKTHDVAMYIIKSHYNRNPKLTYFSGGSNGGRESLMAIQHWPEDYDGIITLYPAFNWTAKFIKDNRNVKALYANQSRLVRSKENKLINDTVLEVCDSLDGAQDGIISNTRSLYQTIYQNPKRYVNPAIRSTNTSVKHSIHLCS